MYGVAESQHENEGWTNDKAKTRADCWLLLAESRQIRSDQTWLLIRDVLRCAALQVATGEKGRARGLGLET